MFDYLFAGRPILPLGGDPTELVSSSRAGFSSKLSESKMAVEAGRKFVLASDEELEQFGKNGRKLDLRFYVLFPLPKVGTRFGQPDVRLMVFETGDWLRANRYSGNRLFKSNKTGTS